MDRYLASFRAFLFSALLTGLIFTSGCSPGDAGAPLTADVPLHLEEQLEVAAIQGSDVPDDVPQPVEWNFDEPQPEWRVVEPWEPEVKRPELAQTEDALRVVLGDVDVTDDENDRTWGAIYVDLPDWERDDWAHVQVRARSEADVDRMAVILAFNLREKLTCPQEWYHKLS